LFQSLIISQGELDALNRSTDDINRWETEISKERNKFKSLLNDATQQLSVFGKKSGKMIERARSYYETIKEVKQVCFSMYDNAIAYSLSIKLVNVLAVSKSIIRAKRSVFVKAEK